MPPPFASLSAMLHGTHPHDRAPSGLPVFPTAVIPALLLLLGGCAVSAPSDSPPTRPATAEIGTSSCVGVGQWADGHGRQLDPRRWLRRLAVSPAVLLGEIHTNAEHHRWQLQTLAGLHALNPRLAIGMEAFPRRLQPVLDRWVAGELSEPAFQQASEWDKVWGVDIALYWPILHFARMNRLPLIALNVDRSLVSRVSRDGWSAVPADARDGVGDPAPASAAYQARLRQVLAAHHGDNPPSETAVSRFIAAQQLWDRAMAEAMARTYRQTGRTVVAIVGAGHVRYREGIAHQLSDLGLVGVAALLPWDVDDDCQTLSPSATPRVADGVFGLAAPPAGSTADQKR